MQNESALFSEGSSHSLAFIWCYCKRCREFFEQIIETLEDILVKNRLCLLLQSGKKDFGAISKVVNSTLMILEEIKENVDPSHLKSFKQSEDIIEHCMKSVQIRSFSWSVFSRFRTEYGKIKTRKNSVFGHFSHSVKEFHSLK